MPKREKLTPTQGRILRAMRDDPVGFAAFDSTHCRKLGFGIAKAVVGGLVVRAYGGSATFLKQRGLIELVARLNAPGYWYRLTEAGRAAVAR